MKSLSFDSKIRGAIYIAVAALPGLGTALQTWSESPPKNGYTVAVVIVSCLVSGLIALRAFLDQHISRDRTNVTGIINSKSGATPIP